MRSFGRASATNTFSLGKRKNSKAEKPISNKEKLKLIDMIKAKKISLKADNRDSVSTRNSRSILSHHAMLSAFGYRSKFQSGGQKPQISQPIAKRELRSVLPESKTLHAIR